MAFTKLTKSVLNISALPDRVENQAQVLKATFDQAGVDIKEAHNVLIKELETKEAASNIGAVNLATGEASTVQNELGNIYDSMIKPDGTTIIVENGVAKAVAAEAADYIAREAVETLEGKVLKKDNEEEYVPVGDYNPAPKKYVDDTAGKVLIYEEPSVKKIDRTYDQVLTKNVFFNFTDYTEGSMTMPGEATSEIYGQDLPTMTFTTTLSKGLMMTTSSTTATYETFYAYYNGSEYAALEYVNKILNRTSYSGSNYLSFTKSGERYFDFDFKTPKRVTLNIRINFVNSSASASFKGSNDGETWVSLGSIATKTNVVLDSVEPYRYYRVTRAMSDSMTVYYMYFSNVECYEPSFENAFTISTVLSENQKLLVKTPETFDTENVTKNTLNGIEIDSLLTPRTFYEFIYTNEQLIAGVFGSKVITGNFSVTTVLQTISLSFTPDLVICYNAENNLAFAAGGGDSATDDYYVPRILTKAYENTSNGRIIENGFDYMGRSQGKAVYYIAIKF